MGSHLIIPNVCVWVSLSKCQIGGSSKTKEIVMQWNSGCHKLCGKVFCLTEVHSAIKWQRRDRAKWSVETFEEKKKNKSPFQVAWIRLKSIPHNFNVLWFPLFDKLKGLLLLLLLQWQVDNVFSSAKLYTHCHLLSVHWIAVHPTLTRRK